MGWLAIVLALGQDPAKLFVDAIVRLDEPAAGKHLAAIASIDDLMEAYRGGVKLIAELARDEERAEKHLRDVKGTGMEEAKAIEALDKVRARRAMADDLVPRTCLALDGFARTPEGMEAVKAKMRSAPDWYVRAHAVAALALAPDAKAALVEQLRKEAEPGVRVSLIDALRPHVAREAALQEMWLGFLKDGHWQVQVAALQGLRGGAPKSIVPVLIDAMKGAGGRMRCELNETLKAITNVNKNEHETWKAWWDANGAAFLAGTYVPHISDRADNKSQSTFYGVPIYSTNLAFVVDVSSSMQLESPWRPDGPPAGSSRLEVARHELLRVAKELPNGTRFAACAYHNWPMLFEERATALDDRARRNVAKWLDGLKAELGTATFEALQGVFLRFGGGSWNAKLRPESIDTIYLLTDGEPNGRVQTRALILEKLGELNRFRKVAIHCVAVAPGPDGEVLLKAIAEQNNGTYARR